VKCEAREQAAKKHPAPILRRVLASNYLLFLFDPSWSLWSPWSLCEALGIDRAIAL